MTNATAYAYDECVSRAGEVCMDGFKLGRLLRIFVDETDRHGIEPTYTAVVQLLYSKKIAGATVFRGIEGFGQHHEVHLAKIFSWYPNLPVIIEVVDDADKIDAVLPELESLVDEGLITLEDIEYLKLTRAGSSPRHSAG